MPGQVPKTPYALSEEIQKEEDSNIYGYFRYRHPNHHPTLSLGRKCQPDLAN